MNCPDQRHPYLRTKKGLSGVCEVDELKISPLQQCWQELREFKGEREPLAVGWIDAVLGYRDDMNLLVSLAIWFLRADHSYVMAGIGQAISQVSGIGAQSAP